MNVFSAPVHKFEAHLTYKQYQHFISAIGEAFEELFRSKSPHNPEVGFSSHYSGFAWDVIFHSENLQNLMEIIGNLSILLPEGILDEAQITASQEVVPLSENLETPEEDVIEVPLPQDGQNDDDDSDFPAEADIIEPEDDEDEEEDADEEEEEYYEEELEEEVHDEDDNEDSEDSPQHSNQPNPAKKVFRLEGPKRVKNIAPGISVEES